jgi:TorA maturation chaperone TorD
MTDNRKENGAAPLGDADLWLAYRLYLYRLFHAAFGSTPTPEAVRLVFAPLTDDALRAAEETPDALGLAGVRKQRLGVAGPTVEAGLEDARATVRGAADRGDDAAFADQLASDYQALYLVPGERYVRPWESPYTGPTETLFQPSTLDVRSYYHEAGFQLKAEQHFPDDHIAAMMDFMAALAQKAYDAAAAGDDEQVRTLLATQARFLDEHVLIWVDVFASATAEHDGHGVYRALASGMAAFARVDRACIGRMAGLPAK